MVSPAPRRLPAGSAAKGLSRYRKSSNLPEPYSSVKRLKSSGSPVPSSASTRGHWSGTPGSSGSAGGGTIDRRRSSPIACTPSLRRGHGRLDRGLRRVGDLDLQAEAMVADGPQQHGPGCSPVGGARVQRADLVARSEEHTSELQSRRDLV